MVLTLSQLIEHFEKLKQEGWSKEACQDGGLDLDSDVYLERSGIDDEAIEIVFKND